MLKYQGVRAHIWDVSYGDFDSFVDLNFTEKVSKCTLSYINFFFGVIYSRVMYLAICNCRQTSLHRRFGFHYSFVLLFLFFLPFVQFFFFFLFPSMLLQATSNIAKATWSYKISNFFQNFKIQAKQCVHSSKDRIPFYKHLLYMRFSFCW